MKKNGSYSEQILDDLAPCGLSCRKCLFRKEGEIAKASKMLGDLLGNNWGACAEMFASFTPEFKDYPGFRHLLYFLIKLGCGGCRDGNGCYHGCVPSTCSKEKGLDFCFVCSGFSCSNVNFDEGLRKDGFL